MWFLTRKKNVDSFVNVSLLLRFFFERNLHDISQQRRTLFAKEHYLELQGAEIGGEKFETRLALALNIKK